MARQAPETIVVPSGRTVRLEYGADGAVSASVKLQEVFGLADTPRIGPEREPVLFSLLAPNGRPVQITRDLRSFWDRTYPEVGRELRGRYPKHPWPDDPWNAKPTRGPRDDITRSSPWCNSSRAASSPWCRVQMLTSDLHHGLVVAGFRRP